MSDWASGSGLAFGDEDLQVDEVEAGDELGDGMLDLEAGVHFEEVEGFVPACAVDEELDGAGVDVAGGEREADGGLAHARRRASRDDGGGGFLDDLLVAALDAALALAEVEAVAVGVGEELDLDVAGRSMSFSR
jgi:hypothetical protein